MFKAGNKKIGRGRPVLMVAEVSGNHSGDIERAKRIIDAAADAGADAVKLQTYTADTMTLQSDAPYFKIRSKNPEWNGKTLHELYAWAQTPWEWHAKLFAHARTRGLMYFSTPFDETAVDFLETLKVPLYKVASFEIVDIPLLERIGKTKKPVIMSRGMATLKELSLALKTLKKAGAPRVAVLQCVSEYPAKSEDMHLSNIPDITKRFKVEAGLSDHTLSNDVVVAAVALGARIIEKHLTLKRADGGPDAAFSLEPHEFKRMVDSVRETEKAIGKPSYERTKGEKENIVFRRSLFAVKDIRKGERFTKDAVRSIRPGHGLAPKELNRVLTKRAARDIKRGEPLSGRLLA